MKKLMIAAAIVCAAAFAQAATVSWTSTGKLVDEAGTVQTSLESGSIVAIILADNTGWSDGTWTAASGKVTELGTSTIGTGSKTKGKVNGVKDFSYGTTLANNDVVAVVFKDGSGAYSQLKYQADGSAVTDTLKISGLEDNGWTGELTFATGGNFMAAVPEPTSGLLLLLGMAGLALRRRRA